MLCGVGRTSIGMLLATVVTTTSCFIILDTYDWFVESVDCMYRPFFEAFPSRVPEVFARTAPTMSTEAAIVPSSSAAPQMLATEATPPRNIIPESERKRKLKLGPSGYSWLAEKVPKIHKTGNDEKDHQLERDRSCFQHVIDACMADPMNIACAYGAIQKRKSTQVLDVLTDDLNAKFQKLPSQVDRLPEQWVMKWVSQNSDLSMDDLVKCYKRDPFAPYAIFIRMTEMPGAMRFPKQCLVKLVCDNLARWRYEALRKRGAEFKKKGALLNDGSIDWKNFGAYKLLFGEDGARVESMVHTASGETLSVQKCVNITKEFVLKNNYSDHAAFVECKPLPPIRIATLWQDLGYAERGVGPFAYEVLSGGANKSFNTKALEVFGAWQFEEERRTSGSNVEALQDYKSEVTKARLSKARAKAAAQLKQRQESRTIKLT